MFAVVDLDIVELMKTSVKPVNVLPDHAGWDNWLDNWAQLT